MSPHVEWMEADCVIRIAEPQSFEDSYGTTNEKPALVLGFDDLMVIEGSKEQMLVMLARATQLVAALDNEPTAWRLTVAEANRIAERELTADQLERLAEAIPHSSIPEALSDIVFAVAGADDDA